MAHTQCSRAQDTGPPANARARCGRLSWVKRLDREVAERSFPAHHKSHAFANASLSTWAAMVEPWVSRRKGARTTVADPRAASATDLVRRDFSAKEPNRMDGVLRQRQVYRHSQVAGAQGTADLAAGPCRRRSSAAWSRRPGRLRCRYRCRPWRCRRGRPAALRARWPRGRPGPTSAPAGADLIPIGEDAASCAGQGDLGGDGLLFGAGDPYPGQVQCRHFRWAGGGLARQRGYGVVMRVVA